MKHVVGIADGAGTANRDVWAGSGNIGRELETLRVEVVAGVRAGRPSCKAPRVSGCTGSRRKPLRGIWRFLKYINTRLLLMPENDKFYRFFERI